MSKIKKQHIVIVAIVVSLALSLFIWLDAIHWNSIVQESDGWYGYPWYSRFEITYSYFVAFIKIILIDIWIFTSAFLILKVIPSNIKPHERNQRKNN